MIRSDGRRGGILFGLLLAALGTVCLLMFIGMYIAHNVKVETTSRRGGSDVSIDTPVGHLDVRARDHLDPAALGVPVYPGSHRAKDSGGATVEWIPNDGHDSGGVSVAGAELITSDSAGKVVDYYRSQLPNWMIVRERDGEIRLELEKGGYKRIVAIHEKGDGTHIGVARVGEPAAN
jgi:hypothetical protein